MSTIQIKARSEHPLLSKRFNPIGNWEQFLQCWEKAETFEEMLGLLHAGFDLGPGVYNPKQGAVDRLVFYFKIADGWYNNASGLHSFDDHEYFYRIGPYKNGYASKSKRDLRLMLVKKAFNVLCLNFFKIEGKEIFNEFESDENTTGWLRNNIVNNDILPIIFKFFLKKKDNGELEICNISHHHGEWPHPEKHVLDFLLGLTDFLFQWGKEEIGIWYWENQKEESERKEKANSEMQELIYSARPLMIEILNRIRKLDVLEKYILNLDEASVLKLTEIALREELSHCSHQVNENRKVATIEEAIFVGSAAALLVKKHEIMTKEKEKLGIIFESEIAIEIAQQKIAEVRS